MVLHEPLQIPQNLCFLAYSGGPKALFEAFWACSAPIWGLENPLDISRDPQMTFWAYPGVLGGPYWPTQGGSEAILDLSKGLGSILRQYTRNLEPFEPIQGCLEGL